MFIYLSCVYVYIYIYVYMKSWLHSSFHMFATVKLTFVLRPFDLTPLANLHHFLIYTL